MSNISVAFDLDDTLYKEIDFVRSGYCFIDRKLSDLGFCRQEEACRILWEAYMVGKNPFLSLNQALNIDLPIDIYLRWYRFHVPDISLDEITDKVLVWLLRNGVKMGLISDGRSITQRNKIHALGLDKYINDNIIISEEVGSEKPSSANYEMFSKSCKPNSRFVYVGDNPSKDFITPNRLGWITIGLKDDGRNIHKQVGYNSSSNPTYWISNIDEIVKLLYK